LTNEIAKENCNKTERAYVEQYNLRSRPKSFDKEDQVLVLLPDSTNKLMSSWQGPGIIDNKLSDNSYAINMPNGSVRHFHANNLRKFKTRVNGVGVIFDDEKKLGK